MVCNQINFGSITIDNQTYDYDIVIHNGTIAKRNKKASKSLKSNYGHTPLTVGENIPWNCKTLIIGTGMYGSLPITQPVLDEAKKRLVSLIAKPTGEAINHLNDDDTNYIFHLTC